MNLLLLLALLQPAQVEWSLTPPKANTPVKAGAKVAVSVKAQIAQGWHLYSLKKMEDGPIPTTIRLPDGQPFRLAGEIDAPAPMHKYEEAFQADVEYYEGTVEFTLPVEAGRDAKPGAASLLVSARYQACDNRQCLPPRTVKLELPLEIQ
jgi:hypothetical protein